MPHKAKAPARKQPPPPKPPSREEQLIAAIEKVVREAGLTGKRDDPTIMQLRNLIEQK